MQMMSKSSERNNNIDNDLIDELLNADDDISLFLDDTHEENEERMIKYNTFIACYKDDELKRISFSDVDDYDFNQGFIEFLISEDYVHLYFDFDSISNEVEFEEVLTWLSELSETFGKFTIGGYTDNETMSNSYGFRLYPRGNHFLSMHVVFPETRISTTDLSLIMKHDSKNGYITKGVIR